MTARARPAVVGLAGRVLALHEARDPAAAEAIALLERIAPPARPLGGWGHTVLEMVRPAIGLEAARERLDALEPAHDVAALRAAIPVRALSGDTSRLRALLDEARAREEPDLAAFADWGEAARPATPSSRSARPMRSTARGEHYTAARLLADLVSLSTRCRRSPSSAPARRSSRATSSATSSASPELRDSTTFALMDIDAERLRTAEIVAAPARRRARRRRDDRGDASIAARRSTAPTTSSPRSRSAATSRATVVDFEVPKRYGLRQTIADTLGIGGIMRGLRTIPVLLDVCRDMEEVCPDALLLNYVNPMAMHCWAVAEASADPDGRPLPLASSTRRASSPPTSGCPPTSSTTTSPASTTWRSSCASSTTARTSTRALARRDAGRVPTEPRALRDAAALRLLRDRVLASTSPSTSPWFIKRRPPGPDRALQHPARRVPAPLRAPDRRVGGAARRRSRAAASSASSAAPSTAPTSSAPARPASRSRSTATSRTGRERAADRQPARRLLRRGAVRRRRQRHRAAAGRRAAAAARGADADQRQRPGADRRGGADRPPRRTSTTPRCSTRTPPPSSSLDEICALVDDLLEAHGDWIPQPPVGAAV